jgi:membrane protease YdiL (CAAX protease family)
VLFTASRIRPSEEINSVYITSAPWRLHNARNGGSLTSSIGANSNGKSPKSILPIFTLTFAKLTNLLFDMNLKGIYQDYAPIKQAFILLMLLFVSFIIFNALGMLGVSLIDAPSLTDFENKATIQSLKFLQAFSSIGLFIVPPFLFAYLTSKSLNFTAVSRQQFLLTVAIMALSFPLINALALWNESLHLPSFLSDVEAWMRTAESQAMQITEAFLKVDHWSGLCINILIIGVIPALGEELLFRGVIQKELFSKYGKIHLSIWITAFLFSAIHLQFLGFIPRFLIGGLLGYLFYWSGSIWLPIIAHFVNNAGAVILSYLIGQQSISNDVEYLVAEEGQFSMLVIALLGLLMMSYLLKSISKPQLSS